MIFALSNTLIIFCIQTFLLFTGILIIIMAMLKISFEACRRYTTYYLTNVLYVLQPLPLTCIKVANIIKNIRVPRYSNSLWLVKTYVWLSTSNYKHIMQIKWITLLENCLWDCILGGQVTPFKNIPWNQELPIMWQGKGLAKLLDPMS